MPVRQYSEDKNIKVLVLHTSDYQPISSTYWKVVLYFSYFSQLSPDWGRLPLISLVPHNCSQRLTCAYIPINWLFADDGKDVGERALSVCETLTVGVE